MARGSSPLTRGKHALSIRVRRALGLIPAHAGKTLPVSPRRSRTRAHPRSRGENMGLPIGYVSTPGSSPLTRGKRRIAAGEEFTDRLIPAHAGKTYSSAPTTRRSRAHPRSRGENARRWAHRSSQTGSSPLTRGKPDDVDGFHVGPGLIPAHAGKTQVSCAGVRTGWAHPRSRGENCSSGRQPIQAWGSSPLTRGKLAFTIDRAQCIGLIPAHAGKTVASGWNVAGGQAHPRSRGENRSRPLSTCTGIGSSPLTRGKRRLTSMLTTRSRLIPAHAGKTPEGRQHAAHWPAHPRSRGENVLPRLPSADFAGSSPLTRGKLDVLPEVGPVVRLIPAHAGKTRGCWVGRRRTPAHPRSRGENTTLGIMPGDGPGSSPLTRGKP